MSVKRKVAILKKIIVALGVVFLGGATGHAQNTPTLSVAAGKVGISASQNGAAPNFEFFMDPAGYPRTVTAGQSIFMTGSWPSGNNPPITDDKSNVWRARPSGTDRRRTTHGVFCAINAAAGTSVISQTHS